MGTIPGVQAHAAALVAQAKDRREEYRAAAIRTSPGGKDIGATWVRSSYPDSLPTAAWKPGERQQGLAMRMVHNVAWMAPGAIGGGAAAAFVTGLLAATVFGRSEATALRAAGLAAVVGAALGGVGVDWLESRDQAVGRTLRADNIGALSTRAPKAAGALQNVFGITPARTVDAVTDGMMRAFDADRSGTIQRAIPGVANAENVVGSTDASQLLHVADAKFGDSNGQVDRAELRKLVASYADQRDEAISLQPERINGVRVEFATDGMLNEQEYNQMAQLLHPAAPNGVAG